MIIFFVIFGLFPTFHLYAAGDITCSDDEDETYFHDINDYFININDRDYYYENSEYQEKILIESLLFILG